jgi:transposase
MVWGRGKLGRISNRSCHQPGSGWQRLQQDPFSGCVFVFRNRRATALKALVYDGQGFWLCHKRLSSGRFHWWPTSAQAGEAARTLAAHELHVLFSAGNPAGTQAAPDWRPVSPKF